MGGAPRHHR
jgi:hypothetical protein